MTDVYIIGAGTFGRETLDACLAAGIGVVAFADERMVGSCVRNLPVIPVDAIPHAAAVVVAISDPTARRRLADTVIGAWDRTLQTVIHPRASVAPETEIGPGSVVLANVYVSSSCQLGSQVHVSYNATIGHEARLDDAVTVMPGANIASHTHIEAGVTVGSNACVMQGVRVGASASVGAGAVVTRDVAPGTVATGAPAQGWRSSGHAGVTGTS
jgi:sugar O-acyltransferase (sialic acid O-acetyltransferase NeuD family)